MGKDLRSGWLGANGKSALASPDSCTGTCGSELARDLARGSSLRLHRHRRRPPFPSARGSAAWVRVTRRVRRSGRAKNSSRVLFIALVGPLLAGVTRPQRRFVYQPIHRHSRLSHQPPDHPNLGGIVSIYFKHDTVPCTRLIVFKQSMRAGQLVVVAGLNVAASVAAVGSEPPYAPPR